jgi:hypothetical protein
MLGEKVVTELISYLIQQDDFSDYDEHFNFIDRDDRPKFFNLYLAAACLKDILSKPSVKPIAKKLLDELKYLAMTDLDELTSIAIIEAISTTWKDDPDTLRFLQACVYESEGLYASDLAISWMARQWRHNPDTLTWIKDHTQHGEIGRFSAVAALANYWKDDPDTLPILKIYAQSGDEPNTSAVIKAIVLGWKEHPDTANFLSDVVIKNSFSREVVCDSDFGIQRHIFHGDINPRKIALEALLNYYPTYYPKTLELLKDRAINDPDEQLREWAQGQLQQSENQGGSS